VSYLNFLDWQRDTQTFSSMAIYRNQDYTLIGTGDGERVRGYMISADFFSTLGVQPLWGRAFRPDDDQPGAPPVVILGGGFWKRKFGSSLEIVGKARVLNGTSYTVVGVIPAGFTGSAHPFGWRARDRFGRLLSIPPLRLLLFGANATICCSMSPTDTRQSEARRPRVGIPWRTSAEEEAATTSGKLGETQDYIIAVERAGAEGVVVPLQAEQARNQLIPTLDAFVLPGSPADVEPRQYGSINRGLSAPADSAREETDRAILQHAFAEKKPVLAICYGCQLLNVYLGGTLIQDLRVETRTATPHRKKDLVPEPKEDPTHSATLESGSRLATLAGRTRAVINSSHHQAIREPGTNLRVTSRASDGTIEGVEWTGDSNWVTGVQWHPERMLGDAFSERLFCEFVSAANARDVVAHKT
jgi:putative glutamine amidotransferase